MNGLISDKASSFSPSGQPLARTAVNIQDVPFPADLRRCRSRHDALDDLSKIRCPVLLLHGSEDRVNPTGNVFVMKDEIPNAEVHLVTLGRHLFFLEFDRETAGAVNKFLAD